MTLITKIKNDILQGKLINKQEALALSKMPLDALASGANEIREYFCGRVFDICTIINGKSGKCSENCKYCAQSSLYNTKIEEYPLLSAEEILKQAKYNDKRGVLRYSIVTSDKGLNDGEIEAVCESIQLIKEQTAITVCASLGLLTEPQFNKLKEAGVERIHNNLETSENNFPNVCTTHTYQDKIKSIKAAQKAGLNVCSGGIIGLGESMEDRIDMIIAIRELGIRSIPVNILNPIKGTPYENHKIMTSAEMSRIVALFRFLVPTASIRMAGGRGLLPDKGRQCFLSGANAAISGEMLTTAGISTETDMKMLADIGYQIGLWNE
ncbi:MAG: biotin synthase BioB [Acetobacterium sp.]